MNPRRHPAGPPSASELRAFRNGELDPAEHPRVEAWLAAHPEAAEELAASDALAQLFRAEMPADPSEADWQRVLAGVERGLRRSQAENPVVAVRRRRFGWFLVAGSAAAALLLALLLPAFFRHAQTTQPMAEVEPFPVAASEDVEILEVDANDAGALVVGEMPFRSPIVLVGPGDVSLVSLGKDANGDWPEVQMHADGNDTPMYYAGPVGQAPKQ